MRLLIVDCRLLTRTATAAATAALSAKRRIKLLPAGYVAVRKSQIETRIKA